ncbi:hypothetical protein [Nocardia sp. CA-290969]|uniref:hypothetical protein n=1 Tax=Nocardia sp. CA-290969 TaxID=3239986 RepID=UPI003D940F09
MPCIVVGGVGGSFLPSGMNKSGNQTIPNSTLTLIINWTADTATFPGSSVSSNGLVAQRNASAATLAVEWSVQNSGFTAVTVEVDFRVNTVSLGAPFIQSFVVDGSSTQIRTASVAGIALAEGDVVTVWARGVSGGGTRTLQTGGWMRITQS